MRMHALLATTAFVLFAHAALLQALAGHRSVAAASGDGRPAHAALQLVLVAPTRDAGAAALAQSVTAAQASTMPGASRLPRPDGDAGGRERPTSRPVGEATLDRATDIGNYHASSELDVPARARSAPDVAVLAGLPWSGLPLRIRLFIDIRGAVVDTLVLQSSEAGEVVDHVRRMFLATGFTAGMQAGRPVPSYKDIELTIGTPS